MTVILLVRRSYHFLRVELISCYYLFQLNHLQKFGEKTLKKTKEGEKKMKEKQDEEEEKKRKEEEEEKKKEEKEEEKEEEEMGDDEKKKVSLYCVFIFSSYIKFA